MFIPMINIKIIKFYYLQIQEYEILKIYTLCTFFLCTKENCRKMTI